MELVNVAKRNHSYGGLDIGFLPVEEELSTKLKYDIVRDIPHVENEHIQAVHSCQNNFILAQYLLKKEEAQSKFSGCTERYLYHVTSQSCLESILFNGLDWRRTVRHKFGKGVNFAVSPNYADEHASVNGGNKRVLLKCRVIVGRQHVGDSCTSVPNREADTTTSGYSMEQVFVKFQNNEFFPEYAIFYAPLCIRYGRRNLTYSYSSSNRPLLRDDLILRPFAPQDVVVDISPTVSLRRPGTDITNWIATISVGESENAEAVEKTSSDPRDSENVGILVSSKSISVNLEPSNHPKIQPVAPSVVKVETPASSPNTTDSRSEDSRIPYMTLEAPSAPTGSISSIHSDSTSNRDPFKTCGILILIVFLIVIFSCGLSFSNDSKKAL